MHLTEQILYQSHRFGGAAILNLLHDSLAQHPGPCAEAIQLFVTGMNSKCAGNVHKSLMFALVCLSVCLSVDDPLNPRTRIYVRCHQVLWHQLSSWILHGQLIDPFDEFLIQRSAISIQVLQLAVPRAWKPHRDSRAIVKFTSISIFVCGMFRLRTPFPRVFLSTRLFRLQIRLRDVLIGT